MYNVQSHRTPRPPIIFNKSFQSLQCSEMSIVLFATVEQCGDATSILDGIFPLDIVGAADDMRMCHNSHGSWRVCFREWWVTHIVVCQNQYSQYSPIGRNQ